MEPVPAISRSAGISVFALFQVSNKFRHTEFSLAKIDLAEVPLWTFPDRVFHVLFISKVVFEFILFQFCIF